MGDLEGRLLGMKSQEFSLWVKAYRTESRLKRGELRQQLLKLRKWEGGGQGEEDTGGIYEVEI
jgi:hypothetical protein